jgi:hypothetical protein
VEEVIKGDVRSNLIEFYFFAFSHESDVDLGVRRYRPDVGQRRIYFLKPSNNGYRSVGDVTDYTLGISSGHRAKGSCEGKSSGCCIAELLLVPQPDVESITFAQSLIDGEYVAEAVCSRPVAFDLVRKLTVYPDKQISDSANEVLAAMLEPPRPPNRLIR